MNKNIFKFAIAMVAGVLTLSCAKEKDNDSLIQKPVMVSIAAEPYFTDGTAIVGAFLSQAVDVPVTVTLTPDTKLTKDYTTAIETSLVNAGTITIPAGATEATATVTVNTADLPKGKYETQIVATSSQGANISSNNKANILLLQGVSTVSMAFDGLFDASGVASFTVSLDMFSETDCVVKMAQFEYKGMTNVPAEALLLTGEVTIPAGQTKATGYAAIDLDALTASDFYVVALGVAGISEGRFEVGERSASASAMDFTLPVENENFQAEYLGRTVDEIGNTVELFAVSGVGGYFDYMITSAEAEEVASYIYPKIIAEENDYIAQYMGEYTLDEIVSNDATGVAYITPKKRAPGDYKLWIMAIDEAGTCTGAYNVFDFTIGDEPDPTEAYAAWIGDWMVGSTAQSNKPVVVTISAKDVNKSYYIDDLEGLDTGLYGLSATGTLEEDGTMSIRAQVFGEWEHEEYGTVTDVLAALVYVDGEAGFAVDNNLVLASATLGANGVASLSAGSWYNQETGTLYGIMGMKYYGVAEDGVLSYSSIYTQLPNTLIRVEPDVPDATTEGLKKAHIKVSKKADEASRSGRPMALTNPIRLN